MNVCAMALVLLLDGSQSVGEVGWQNQLDFTADALMHEQVANVIDNTPGGIAIKAVGFGQNQRVLLPWTVLRNKKEREKFATELRDSSNSLVGMMTDIPAALRFSEESFLRLPCATNEKTVDISTDGLVPNIKAVEDVRDLFEMRGIRINAIGFGQAQDLEEFLTNSVRTENGFAVVARSWVDYAVAIRRKIVKEIAQQ
jgi:hypothetical protein